MTLLGLSRSARFRPHADHDVLVAFKARLERRTVDRAIRPELAAVEQREDVLQAGLEPVARGEPTEQLSTRLQRPE